MNDSRKSLYVWGNLILVNVIIALGFVINEGGFDMDVLKIFAAFLIVSIIAALISSSKSEHRNRWGYGIPLVSLIPIPFLLWHASVCSGKFCELGDQILGFLLGAFAVVFTFFYVGTGLLRKWSTKILVSLVVIEILAILGECIALVR